ncbi:MAG: SEC-C metal-binding domain-containing protein [Chloroflexota bacterium]|nr:SEC-C metal-binding domain-containing protein [Chloroflexota bacterium]
MFKWIGRLFGGDTNARVLSDLEAVVEEVNAFEPEIEPLSNDQLRAKTDSFRRRLHEGETLDDILPEAFAVVREAARRTIGQRHFDVQLIGGMVLHQGKIAEMRTGEGKTLVATLPLYLNALEGKGCHLVTVNDYLVRVGAGWMGPIYHLLGVSVAYIAHDQSAIYDPDYLDPKANLVDQRLVHWRPITRREAYEADITYGTNNEFGFDYLRDNIATRFDAMVQRPLNYAIIDEVDNILIDEARTPLIISGPARQPGEEYRYFAGLVRGLRGIEEREWSAMKKEFDNSGDSARRAELQRQMDAADYVIDLKHRAISLTDTGTLKIERKVKEQGRIPEEATLYDPEHADLAHYLDNAVKAEYLFKRDKEYIVVNGEVVIVDEQTGRTMPGRRWSDGLHEAVEAKEGVTIQQENATLATVTIQNYFRMYNKLAGMTGTALTEAEEFAKIYKLDVVPITTHRPMIREDRNDQIFRSEEAKYRAVVREVLAAYVRQQPVLAGTASIENSERLASYLRPNALRTLAVSTVLMGAARDAKKLDDEIRDAFAESLDHLLPQVSPATLRSAGQALGLPVDPFAPEILERFADVLEVDDDERLVAALRNGVPHAVLNAKLHEQEAGIVAQAGRPGAITIATNMAGRGTDILLGGNPDALAAQYLEEQGVRREQVKTLARPIVEGNEAAARQALDKQHLPPLLLDVLKRMRADWDAALSQWEHNPVLYLLQRYVPGDADTFGERWQFVNDVLAGEYGMARDLIQATPGLREEQIAQIAAARSDLEAYRADRAEFLANQLFDRIYAARARLIAAVLHGDDDVATRIVAETPTMDPALIEGVRNIKKGVEEDADFVRSLGGLHITGTERHEARRIDNQLRGRAGRQGDPGSSRFYISLEDELMKRFGPSIERVKGLMGRAGFEDDMPIEFGVISRSIESAQTKVEGYNFDMRKRVVEYDDVMNKQREVIYARRRAILEEGEQQRRIRLLVERYLGGYADWAAGQVEELIMGLSSADMQEIRSELSHVLPGSETLDLEALRDADEPRRAALLVPLIEQAEAERYPLRLLLEDVGEFVELDVDAAWEELRTEDRAAIERYLDERWREGTEGDLEQRIKELFYDEFDALVERYGDGYDQWMAAEIRQAVDDATTQATGFVNVEGALRRIRQRLPQAATLDAAQLAGAGPDVLARQLESLIPASREEGNHLRLFAHELQAIVPFIPGGPDAFLHQFSENLDALFEDLPETERQAAIKDLLGDVNAALQPIFAGHDFNGEQSQRFELAVEEAWMRALQVAGQQGDEALADGLEAMLDRTFDRWRDFIGVELLNRYGRELMLSSIDREWVDYLTAMEDLRQGIGLQGIAQRDPLVAYKTQAFRMFEELLDTIDRTTVRTFFNNLPRYVAQVQQQQVMGQAARARELKVGPNEPCPCGSGKKFKKCHGAPSRQAGTPAGAAAALGAAPQIAQAASGDGQGADRPRAQKLTQQQQQKQSQQGGQRRKSKGRAVPGRRP